MTVNPMSDAQPVRGAGRELDAIIAEKVMGWTLADGTRWETRRELGYDILIGNWAPSTSIADAWQVVEKLNRSKYEILVGTFRGRWNVQITDNGNMVVTQEGETAPLAISLAALKTLEVK